uniref:Capsid polyprotein VP90 n=1 Tax=Human astrovirus-1 TaxID=12456 RepID=Q14V08_HASV1|nr:outer capsid protein [Human astrovirus 1]
MASKSDKQVTVEVNNNGRGRSKSRARSQSRGRGRSVKITVNSQNKGRRQNGRNKRQSNQRVRNIVNKQLELPGFTGPKPAIWQSATATLGTVGSNTRGTTEIEACILLNPVLVKDATGSTQFGPVQALGAQYSMWKLKYLNVRLTSMVGASAVNGTVVRVSLNPTSTPSSTSWSGLGARKHLDVTVGKNAIFKLKPSDLGGPRDGWWLTKHNGNASDTLGPSVEIHTLGRTMSSYQNQQFTGGLFLVELASEWCFTGYAANPNLVNLVTSSDKQVNVTFEGSAGTPLVMNVPAASHFARTVAQRSTLPTSMARAGENTTSDTVWQVLNTAVSAAELVTPPPFNWLVKGGWWFVKLIAGRVRNGNRSLYVYASYQDALSNKPALCTGSTSGSMRTRPAVMTTLQFTQMNQPSLGHGETPATLGRSIPTSGETLKVLLTVGNPISPNETNNQIWLNKTLTAPGTNDQPSLGHGEKPATLGRSIPTSGETLKVLLTVGNPISPNETNKQTWVNKTIEPPGAVVKIGRDTQHYCTLNGFTLIKQQVTSVFLVRVNEGFQVTTHLSYFYRNSVNTDAVENIKIRSATRHTTVRFNQGSWYLLTSSVLHTGPPVSGWLWMNQELQNDQAYIIDQGIMHLITPPPVSSQIYFEMATLVPQTRSGGGETGLELELGLSDDEYPISHVNDEEETEYETESDEDETDEVDRFDLCCTSDSEDDISDENNRVTLLSTLINQGMTVDRATMITNRAFPTPNYKPRREPSNDLLAPSDCLATARSHACNETCQLSGSRGHAE